MWLLAPQGFDFISQTTALTSPEARRVGALPEGHVYVVAAAVKLVLDSRRDKSEEAGTCKPVGLSLVTTLLCQFVLRHNIPPGGQRPPDSDLSLHVRVKGNLARDSTGEVVWLDGTLFKAVMARQIYKDGMRFLRRHLELSRISIRPCSSKRLSKPCFPTVIPHVLPARQGKRHRH